MSSTKAKNRDRCLDKYESVFKNTILCNKYAFVTGGGSGINFRISEALMRHGCNIAIASRSKDRLIHAMNELNNKVGQYNNTKCIYFVMDITDPKQVENTVKNILLQYPRIDILINGAAGNFLCSLEDLSSNAMKKIFEIDTFGTFYATQQCFKQSMKKNKNGVIINMSATLHYRGQMLQTHAGAAKAANDALIRHSAQEWGRYGIRTIALGIGAIANTKGMGMAANKNMVIKGIPLKRMGTKKEIADCCIFLVSKAASYITGETLVIDGGRWLMRGSDGGNMYFNNPNIRKMIQSMKRKRKKSKL